MSEPTPPGALVSIVLATNRGGPYLARTVQSVIEQTSPNWEMVIVDDGSGVPVVIDELVRVDSRCRAVHIPASGLSMARNIGASETRGELLVFLDDDDTWHPDRLRMQVSALAADPAAVGSYCLGVFIDEDDEVVSHAWGPVADREKFLSGESPPPRIVTIAVRRPVFMALGGFLPAFRMAEDNEFILRLLQHGSMVGVPQALVNYRVHASNMSMTTTADVLVYANVRVLTLQRWAAQSRGDDRVDAWLRQSEVELARSTRRHLTRQSLYQLRHGSPGGFVTELTSLVRFTLARRLRALASRVERTP